MKSVESSWRRIAAADDGLEQLCAMVNDNIRLQVRRARRWRDVGRACQRHRLSLLVSCLVVLRMRSSERSLVTFATLWPGLVDIPRRYWRCLRAVQSYWPTS